MRQVFSNNPLFLFAFILLWIKSYIVYKFAFDLDIENWVQEIIMFINPISSSIFFLAFSLFYSGKARKLAIIGISFISSFILFANVVYYREFTDFITIPILFQTSNMGDLGHSASSLINASDFLIFLDTVVLITLVVLKKLESPKVPQRRIVAAFTLAIIMFVVNVGISETERPQLLTRSFDREMLVKFIGAYNYHIYDAVITSKTRAQRAFADGSELVDIENYVKSDFRSPDPEKFGIAKDKNVYIISMESLQSFVINDSIDGQEITPFLNDLINDSYYFPNFYHQTGQGKTSDSEFLLENSLYPLPSGAVFFTHAQNEYNGAPEILKDHGYYSAVFHANNKSFWNRDLMYKSLGYDKFFDVASYEVTPENSIGWGLKDDYFFEQSIEYIKGLPQPFYSKFITLTNHFPFSLETQDELIPEWTSGDGTVDRYFTTVRFMDEALKKFFDQLKSEGLYEDSIFILYGDHYGISENHNEAMAQFLEKEEITPYDTVDLQKVPLIVHIPGEKPEVIETVGGQVDLRPTIMHLLGINTQNYMQFGTDLFSKTRPEFAVLRDGSFITEDVVYTNSICYDKATGEETEKQNCKPYMEKAKKELSYSDKIVYGDLLRFFNNENKEEDDNTTEE
jgi:lipoteichoic acid synthase